MFRIRILMVLLLFFVFAPTFAQNWALTGLSDDYNYREFHFGLAVIEDSNNLYGAINSNGKIVIRPQYEEMSDFTSGLSIVKKSTGFGVINTKGVFLLQPIYEEISDVDYIGESGVAYEVSKDGKKGIFHNGSFVIPLTDKTIYADYDEDSMPFMDIEVGDDCYVYNTRTGDLIEGYGYWVGEIYTIQQDNNQFNYFTKTGERLTNYHNKLKSNNGLEAYYDKDLKLWGFRKGNNIVIKPQFQEIETQLWTNNIINVRQKPDWLIIDGDGKIILKDQMFTLYSKYICASAYEKKDNKLLPKYSILYSDKCKKIWELNNEAIIPVSGTKDFFIDVSSKTIKNVSNGREYKYKQYYVNDNMLMIKKTDEEYYFINTQTGVESPIFPFAQSFREGVALVKTKNEQVAFIDKSFKVLSYFPTGCNVDWHSWDDKRGFYEGVMMVDNRDQNWKGYIYNPLGHGYYKYNNTGNLSFSSDQWLQMASTEFEKENYGLSKDYYYKVMVNEPKNLIAINGYASCLNNLGYYQQALECYQIVLDIDPKNNLALKNKQITEGNISSQNSAEKRTDYSESTGGGSFWNALSNFGNILMSISSGNTNSSYQNYQDYSSEYNSNDSYSSSSNSNSSYFQSQYDRWANRAQSNYESLTLLGHSVTQKNGQKSGGTNQSMNGANYVRMKQLLREAQREMRNIRSKASRQGVSIPQSKWETATVSY